MNNDVFSFLVVALVLYILFLPIIIKINKIRRDKKKVKLLEKLVEEKEKQKSSE